MRHTLFLAALLSLAFAPAPLPRPERRGGGEDGVSAARLQGTWAITKLESTTKTGLVNMGDYLKEVRIESDRWSFIYRQAGNPPVVYSLAVDGGRRPATFDLLVAGQGRPYGM